MSETAGEPLGYLLHRLGAILRPRVAAELKPFGLALPDFVGLRILALHPGLTSAELARDTHVTAQATNQLLHRLEILGAVSRPLNAPTGRALPAGLTEEGRALLARAEQAVAAVDDHVLDGLTAAEQRQLKMLLAKAGSHHGRDPGSSPAVETPPSTTRAQMGRRPGTSATRQAVRDAARARFARDGYASATIRKIAADAGVDASLVIQFFGSKDELFAAAMAIPPDVLTRISSALEGPADGVGERLARAYLTSWEGPPQESEPLLALLRGAISHDDAAAQLRDFIQARLSLAVSGRHDDTDDVLIRVCLAASMLIGVIVGRRIVGVPALVNEDLEAVILRVAPAVQALLTTPNPPAVGEGRDV